jgi:multimeric flavodoxin WrbA
LVIIVLPITETIMDKYGELFQKTLKHLQSKKKVLLLTTSNRWMGEGEEMPKSTALAYKFAKNLPADAVMVIEVPKLNIYPCEGNVSSSKGNNCGVKAAMLQDKEKNPSGLHRCWASFNNQDDELWKISKELFASDCVVFFGSIRWGQVSVFYQKLIERLTWIENRHTSLTEENVVKDIDAGIITIGHNWHGQQAMLIQKQTLKYIGFNIVDDLSWSWQFTDNPVDETNEGYEKAIEAFDQQFLK